MKLVAGTGTTHGNVFIIDGTGTTRLAVDELSYTVTAATTAYTAATSFSVTGGSVDITSGAGSDIALAIASNGAGAGGAVTISGGVSTSAGGGNVEIKPGAGTTTANSGQVLLKTSAGANALLVSDTAYTITAPTAYSVTGGTVDITSGAGSDIALAIASNGAGAGGAITVSGGVSTSAAGGNVEIKPGAGTTTANSGQVLLKTSAGTTALSVRNEYVSTAIEFVAEAGIGLSRTAGNAKITSLLSGTCALSGVTIAAGSVVDTTCTVTGATTGSIVQLGVQDGGVTTDLVFNGWVSAGNTVTIRVHNLNAGSVTVTETFTYIVSIYTTYS